MRNIVKKAKPKAIWGTLLSTGLSMGTSLVSSILEKNAMEKAANKAQQIQSDSQYNSQLANDKISASSYNFNGNNNMKSYFKQGGRINKRFVNGGKINKGHYTEEIPMEEEPVVSTTPTSQPMRRMGKDDMIPDTRATTNDGSWKAGTDKGDIYQYKKVNGKWMTKNSKTGKEFDISNNKAAVDKLEGRKPTVSKPSINKVNSNKKINTNPTKSTPNPTVKASTTPVSKTTIPSSGNMPRRNKIYSDTPVNKSGLGGYNKSSKTIGKGNRNPNFNELVNSYNPVTKKIELMKRTK